MKIKESVLNDAGFHGMELKVKCGLFRGWRWLLTCILGFWIQQIYVTPRCPGAEVNAAKEHELKAVFIYNFVKFAEWPVERLPADGSALIIGVLGKGPIHPALEAAVKDRRAHGRELIVRHVEDLPSARTVHLLFVLGTEDGQLGGLLPGLAGNGTLTVGETEAFLGHGGMICLKVLEDKLRFEINMAAVERDRIKLSAQLQKLATAVRRKG